MQWFRSRPYSEAVVESLVIGPPLVLVAHTTSEGSRVCAKSGSAMAVGVVLNGLQGGELRADCLTRTEADKALLNRIRLRASRPLGRLR